MTPLLTPTSSPRGAPPRGRVRWLRPWMLLAAAAVPVALLTWRFVHNDPALCPPTDSEHHLLNAQLYARTLRLFGLPGLWQLWRDTYVGWPPAAYALFYAPLAALFGEANDTVEACNLALIPLLLWGSYRLGRRLGDRLTGTLAALLVLFSLGVDGQLRQFSIDLPTAAVILLALLALHRNRHWQQPGPAALFGAACGLCLMTRVQAVFFLWGPALVTAVAALRAAPRGSARRRLLLHLGLAAAAALAGSCPWWFGRLGLLWQAMAAHLTTDTFEPRGDPRFFPGLYFYCTTLGRIAGWPTLLVALGTLPRLLLVRPRTPAAADRRLMAASLLALVLGALLSLAAGIHREARYLLPAIPAVALLAALGLRPLHRRPWARISALLLLLTAGPTLLVIGEGLPQRTAWVRYGVLEWAYVRQPFHIPSVFAAQKAYRALLHASGNDEAGRGVYLLLVQQGNYLPRITSFLVPRFPELLFSYTHNPKITNNAQHVAARSRRWLFLLSETARTFNLPLVWELPAGRHGNPCAIRLYRVPPPHRWYGIIDRRDLYRQQRPLAAAPAPAPAQTTPASKEQAPP